jgi:tetratricopeptide (TPR) repeat protein
LLRAGILYAVIFMVWLPLEECFIRLLSAATEGVLALLEHPPIVTALTAHGNSITIHSYITGVPQALTQVHFGDVHLSIVLSLALALAVPRRRWSERVRVCALAFGLVSLVLLVVCMVQVEVAAEHYGAAHLGLELHTAREKAFLNWALEMSSMVLVFLLPAFLFLMAYLSAWSGAGQSDPGGARQQVPVESGSGRWIRVRATVLSLMAAVGFLILLLVAMGANRADRVDLEGLRKIVKLNPASASAQLNLAFNLEKTGRFDEALQSYRTTLRLQPDLTSARRGEGNILFRQGTFEAAGRCYEEVLRQQPGDLLARYNLGTTFLHRKLFEPARASFEQLLQASPDDAAALRSLGQALLGLDRPCDALPHLERSILLDSGLAQDAALSEQIRSLRSRCAARQPDDSRPPPAPPPSSALPR